MQARERPGAVPRRPAHRQGSSWGLPPPAKAESTPRRRGRLLRSKQPPNPFWPESERCNYWTYGDSERVRRSFTLRTGSAVFHTPQDATHFPYFGCVVSPTTLPRCRATKEAPPADPVSCRPRARGAGNQGGDGEPLRPAYPALHFMESPQFTFDSLVWLFYRRKSSLLKAL
jgi:hypothetical protein